MSVTFVHIFYFKVVVSLSCYYYELFKYEMFVISEMFHDLQEDNVATVLFQQSCDNSPAAIADNIARYLDKLGWDYFKTKNGSYVR